MEGEEGLLTAVVGLGVVYLVFSPCKEKTEETQEEKRKDVSCTEIPSRLLLLLFSKP